MEKDLVSSATTIQSEYRTPIISIRRRLPSGVLPGLGTRNPPRLLFIHGLSASKSVMMQMAIEMAQSGAECYLMDLPGHGASEERFSWEASRRAVQEVSNWILQLPKENPHSYPKIDFFLIGHSLGGGLAIEGAQENGGVTGVIALSPASVPVTRNSPAHLLILYGEYDFPFVQRGAAFLLEGTAGLASHLPKDLHRWEPPGGSHRIVLLEQAEHSGGLFLPQAYREIKGWINRTVGDSALELDSCPSPSARAAVKGLLCIAALAAWFPSFSLLGKALLGRPCPVNQSLETTRQTDDSPQSPVTGFQIYGAYALFSFMTLVALKGFNPWESLHLLGGGFLSGFLSITGMALLVWKTPSVQALNLSPKSILCSFAGFLLLVLYPFGLISIHFAFFQLTPLRGWRLPVIILSTLPFFLWDEWAFRNLLSREGNWRLVGHFLSTRLILAISTMLGFFILKNAQFLILLLLPGLAIMSVLSWIGSGWIFAKTRSCAASALFSSLLTGWIFSTFFAQI
jgi:pimeloyl-ACP methyl ester carboxylesterase